MDINIWYVISFIDRSGEKRVSMAKLNGKDNIVAYVRDFPGLMTMNACKTKKEAYRIASNWRKANESF